MFTPGSHIGQLLAPGIPNRSPNQITRIVRSAFEAIGLSLAARYHTGINGQDDNIRIANRPNSQRHAGCMGNVLNIKESRSADYLNQGAEAQQQLFCRSLIALADG